MLKLLKKILYLGLISIYAMTNVLSQEYECEFRDNYKNKNCALECSAITTEPRADDKCVFGCLGRFCIFEWHAYDTNQILNYNWIIGCTTVEKEK